MRSGLTVLGIMIGIAAVILTVGLGQGAQNQVSSEINALGTNLLTISPGSTTSSSRHPRWLRLGIDPDRDGRHRSGLQAVGTGHQGGGTDRVVVRDADGRILQLDHHGERDYPQLGNGPQPERHLRDASSTTRTSPTTRRWPSSGPIRPPSCSAESIRWARPSTSMASP